MMPRKTETGTVVKIHQTLFSFSQLQTDIHGHSFRTGNR